jgi:hypothetical protein
MANDRVSVGLGWPRGEPRDRGIATQRLAWQEPEHPGLPADFPRRVGPGRWFPLATVVLARHRSPDGHVKFSNSYAEPRGYHLNRLMGFVQRDPQPSTRQITKLDDELFVADSHGEVPADHVLLGHVDQLPYSMLVPLELRRLHHSGQVVLVGDERDPMRHESDYVSTVGWVEAAPIEPLGPIEHTASWGLATLTRRLDREARRHRYDVLPGTPVAGETPGATRLGGVWDRPFGAEDAMVALERTGDGRLRSVLAASRAGRPTLLQGARWAGAPVRWTGPRWSTRAVAGRAVRLARSGGAQGDGGSAGAHEVVGWLRREPAPGCTPLFSATHPVVGDQFVTRSEMEASDLGYLVDGVLGHVADRGADRPPVFEELPWASRFGRGRRYVEGHIADAP